MGLLLYLFLLGIISFGCHALEEIFHDSLPQHDLENCESGVPSRPSRQGVDMISPSALALPRGVRMINEQAPARMHGSPIVTDARNTDPRNMKRLREFPECSSLFSSHDGRSFKQTYRIDEMENLQQGLISDDATALFKKSSVADQPWYDGLIAHKTNPLASTRHEISSSNSLTASPQVSIDNAHQSHRSLLSNTPISHDGHHQDANSWERSSQALFGKNSHSHYKPESSESIQEWLSIFEENPNGNANIIEKEQPNLTREERISDWSHLSPPLLGDKPPVIKNQNLIEKQNLKKSRNARLFPQELVTTEKEIQAILNNQGPFMQTIDPETTKTLSRKQIQKKEYRAQDIRIDKNILECGRISKSVFAFLQEIYHIQAKHYESHGADSHVKDIFPAYLIYVQLIDEIIPSQDLKEGGMQSACESFLELSNFPNDVKIKKQNPLQWQEVVDKINSKATHHRIRLLWCFLQNWLNKKRPALYKIVGDNRGSTSVGQRFKSHVNSIFVKHFKRVTEELLRPVPGDVDTIWEISKSSRSLGSGGATVV